MIVSQQAVLQLGGRKYLQMSVGEKVGPLLQSYEVCKTEIFIKRKINGKKKDKWKEERSPK